MVVLANGHNCSDQRFYHSSEGYLAMQFLSLFLLTLLITGCVTTSQKNQPNKSDKEIAISIQNVESDYADKATYHQSGKTYYTENSTLSLKQRGQASWYGHAFHGRRTASGEKFNMHAMTAAHSSAPLHSYMRVTNKSTGKSVIVRVNDRMPRHKTRVIDVSYAAAKELGLHRAGVATVELERVYLKE